MAGDFNNKNIDGITDLVVMAPIREGFISAFENVTFATRLELVGDALNRMRVAAREHERITPYSDVTERILTLLDFRIGTIDQNLFTLPGSSAKGGDPALESRRYLCLAATFDGAWEPYMRRIWDPLGPFLDLLFINCEGYVTAVDHSFEEYIQWVRDHQVKSAIFYAASPITVQDSLYLAQIERRQRGGDSAAALARATMLPPETLAALTRAGHPGKALELGLEALTVFYRFADYYPPQWLTGGDGKDGFVEGHRLLHVARDVLKGWDALAGGMDALVAANPTDPKQAAAAANWQAARQTYKEPLHWYESGSRYLAERLKARDAARRPDPAHDEGEVQAGILKPPGSAAAPVRQGALLLFSIRDAAGARAFLGRIGISWHGEATPAGQIISNVGLTADGLRRLGADPELVNRFPREFREGMAARSGLLGDMRENHPRNWILPERNGLAVLGLMAPDVRLPPVELSEVDIVVQLRSSSSDRGALITEIKKLAATDAVALQAVEWLEADYDPQGRFRDHFGFIDGISQPRPRPAGAQGPSIGDEVRRGEILLGYANDRTDGAPGPFAGPRDWRRKHWADAHALQKDGSFLVLRKIGTDNDAFSQWIEASVKAINDTYNLKTPMTADRLKARILGRSPDGTPPLPGGPGGNGFDFSADPEGTQCPLASHIRRANPRRSDFGRGTPRLLRRGMRFNQGDQRGLMFMAYNASIAEQYEVVQRWLNGGNSTGIASAHNDPLTGVQPRDGEGVFRFVEERLLEPCEVGRPDVETQVAISLPLPPVLPGEGPNAHSEPGRHPFAPLHWGLYLFVPSRTAVATMMKWNGHYSVMAEPLEAAVGLPIIRRLRQLEGNPQQAANELKRLLEDFDAKDPSEADLTPNVWSTIRWQLGGATRFGSGVALMPPHYDWQTGPHRTKQGVILCAGRRQVRAVLANWADFSTEEQLRRIAPNSGPIFVTQQPDNRYFNTDLAARKLDYAQESEATNAILMAYTPDMGFAAGYAAATDVLQAAKRLAEKGNRKSFKLELRRQFLLPALAGLCQRWYGLPDGEHMAAKGWTWEKFVAGAAADTQGQRGMAHCPGDFLSPSRNAFYPRPEPAVQAFAANHGTAILAAASAFVAKHRDAGGPPVGSIARAMFAAIRDDDEVLARNLVGTMVGAIPPMDGNLRGILFEWLNEKSLWRHQAALHAALGGQRADTKIDVALKILRLPISQAMCKRPAPDLLYRTATRNTQIEVDEGSGLPPVEVQKGDLVIVSQVAAAQRSLLRLRAGDTGEGDVSIVFGGRRRAAAQGHDLANGVPVPPATPDDYHPVHACPAQDMAMGAIMGIMAALLDSGTIQALPASLIVKISDWPPVPPQAGG
ncbi:hypothetical protein CHU93_16820 [Sandarakinorhabdus cyanobacteriorum]|uniref:Dyp-type peroxidase C-terminal domain-containing protein n=1 Tax=Sandarakinorhabdus cyanobacteriorum TaxID=1981098 RepID=A0A255Y5G6_9SPHN|nr:Dyp-type peroxidase domain-containing protein [Sandarakinorhabdus cyanobacteriorum]OYQ23855.1 hypothetical protein CHU93_16820 [Sandarakinorhabdus cyanobacteriorum]